MRVTLTLSIRTYLYRMEDYIDHDWVICRARTTELPVGQFDSIYAFCEVWLLFFANSRRKRTKRWNYHAIIVGIWILSLKILEDYRCPLSVYHWQVKELYYFHFVIAHNFWRANMEGQEDIRKNRFQKKSLLLFLSKCLVWKVLQITFREIFLLIHLYLYRLCVGILSRANFIVALHTAFFQTQ